MTHIRRRRGWEIPESQATPESVYLERRRFLKALGLAGVGLTIGAGLVRAGDALAQAAEPRPADGANPKALYPAQRNPAFTLDRAITDERLAATYNNFYEFSEKKDQVARLVDKFQPRPWQIQVTGLVEKPFKMDVDDLIARLPLEERLYRHRCVEAWAMAVPWTGIPMKKFIEFARPLSGARFVRSVSFLRPEQAPNQKIATWYKWPYYEGWRMDEMTNELALLTVGIYGHPLPRVHGAPIRIVTPWKYGYKSAKSIVTFEFVKNQPPTFWHDVAPDEYSFLSNVDPKKPHPRWSQATERLLGTEERVPTLPYNGYGEWVAELYAKG